MQDQTIQSTGNFEDSKIKFNPWAVTDASVFMKYCCPECEFKDPIFQHFADHAVSYHPNASSLFIDEDNIELPNTQIYIKVEENSSKTESKPKISRKKKRKTQSKNNLVLCEICPILQLSSTEEVRMHRQEKHMNGKETCCPYCDQKLKNFTLLKVHIDSVHPESGEKKFSCDECIIDFIFESSYKIHKSAKHATLKKYVCDICEHESNRKERFENHMITKHNSDTATKLFCDICEFSALTKRKLYRHKLHHHSTRSHKQCPHCEYKTINRKDLHVHIDRKHQEQGGEKNYSCDDCGKSFIYQNSLTNHKRYVRCKSLKSKIVKVKEKKGNLDFNICPYCEYKTIVKKDLDIHIDRKHQEQGGEKNYSCEDCGKCFIYPDSLTAHKRPGRCKSFKNKIVKVKEKRGNLVCNVCGFECYRKDRFDHHMITEHNADGAKALFCEICGFSALSKLKLNRHKWENHNSIELKKCPYCYRKYRQNAGLHIHIDAKHEKQGGEKKYLCENCDKSFIFPESLANHVKSHI